MNIEKATRSFEQWLAEQTRIVPEDLELKHRQMSGGVFPFFRATFYRWLSLWKESCKDEQDAPPLLAVGDLHVENFGTWRDSEGRLIWGVNDFDEAWTLPYTMDLVRLATSALLAHGTDGTSLTTKVICQAILGGYSDAIKAGGRPFVLGERHPTLSALAHGDLRNPVAFWQRMREQPELERQAVPSDVIGALETMLPEPRPPYRIVHRAKGLGSLGRQRFIALADWHGGLIAHEAKALLPSACAWFEEVAKPPINYTGILASAVRCPDPLLKIHENWIVRRLAPDCSRIELASLAGTDEIRLLRAMGWETANIHLGAPNAANAIRKDLRARPRGWLRAACRTMVKAVMQDWQEWRASRNATGAAVGK